MSAGPDNRLRRSLGALGVALYRLGLARTVTRLSRRRVRALLYHAVEPEPDSFTAGLGVSVTPAAFAAHMDLCRRLYRVVSPDAPDDSRDSRPRLVVTFDDGYASVYRHALPLLAERRLTACVYLVGRAVRGRLVWVNLVNHAVNAHAAEALAAVRAFDPALAPGRDGTETGASVVARVLDRYGPARIESLCAALLAAVPALRELDGRALFASAEQVLEMRAGGLSFGFHTADHVDLTRCDDAELERQMDASGLVGLLDSDSFAYPFGRYDARVAARAHRAASGVIMTVGNNNARRGPRHLDRTEVLSADPARLFAALEVVEPVVAWLRRRSGRAGPASGGERSRPGGASAPGAPAVPARESIP